MIEVENIVKRFGTLEVLRGVNLRIGQGEIVGIVGPSGAGKTTLLQIVGTLDKPDDGRVLYDGVDVLRLKDKEMAHFRNRNIGFVFQFHQLLPEFTSLENVAIPALIGGEKREDAYARAKELLAFMNLSERMDHKPAQLSGGERQRLVIARALLNSPTLILADEPTGNLDPVTAESIVRLFHEIAAAGTAVVMATHNTSLIESYPSRTLLFSQGAATEVDITELLSVKSSI